MPADSPAIPALPNLCVPETDSSHTAVAAPLRDLTRHDPDGLATWARQVSRLAGCIGQVTTSPEQSHD